jgi:tetratricopeptide (TPR) repeat protein
MNRAPKKNGDNATPGVLGQSTASLDAQVNEAVEHHRAGRLFEAEEIYRRVLAAEPDHPFALCLLGTVVQAAGEYDQAVDLISRAIAVKPDYMDAYINLGTVLLTAARFEEALASLEQALALDPDSAEAHSNKGLALMELDRPDDAAASYRRAIEIQPEYAKVHFNLGHMLNETGRADDAIESYPRAIEFQPEYAEAHQNLGNVFRDQGQSGDAIASYRRAIEFQPDYAEAHANLGNALKDLGRFEDAAEAHEKAIRLKPDLAQAYSNLGSVRQEQGRFGEAAANYQKALAGDLNCAEFHLNLGLVRLLTGDFDNGWQEYDWPLRTQEFSLRRAEHDKPLWDGSPISGKRLLVCSEQGVGDEILFAGLIPNLIERGIDVILESDARLLPLFSRSFPSITGIAKGCEDQAFDFHIPSGGLGRVLRPSLGSFPEPTPYLVADPKLCTELRDLYHDQGTGALVGISWYSNSPESGRQCSLTLPELRPLLETPEVTFIDLQYGDTADQRSAFARETGIDIVHDDQIDQMVDLDAFAAQVSAMDLVLSIDNSTVHMAGALGVPTWAMLRPAHYWCWGLDRDDSPWYPSLRLFRQDTPGDWSGILERVCVALGEWAGNSRN